MMGGGLGGMGDFLGNGKVGAGRSVGVLGLCMGALIIVLYSLLNAVKFFCISVKCRLQEDWLLPS